MNIKFNKFTALMTAVCILATIMVFPATSIAYEPVPSSGNLHPITTGLTSFHLGNSLTDSFVGLPHVMNASGITHTFHRNTPLGAATSAILGAPASGWTPWRAGGVFSVDSLDLDIITAQVFPSNGGTGNVEIASQMEVYTLARRFNPNIRYFVYETWNHKHSFEQNARYMARDAERVRLALNELREELDYIEGVESPGIYLIPSNQAILNLKELIESGGMPGWDPTDQMAFYNFTFRNDDPISSMHFNPRGMYFMHMLLFSMLYRTNPAEVINHEAARGIRSGDLAWFANNQPFGEFSNITVEQMEILAELAWQTAISFEHSGIYGGNARVPELIAPTPAQAAPFTYFDIDGGAVTIHSTVYEIPEFAFADRADITSVYIPDTVTIIGDFAFNRCVNLATATGGESLEYIGKFAFGNNQALTSLNLPDSVSFIGAGAFSNCHALPRIMDGNNLPAELTRINMGTFLITLEMRSVNFHEDIESIGAFSFASNTAGVHNRWADNGLSSVTIPATVESIGPGAFHYINNLTQVTIAPNGITEIPAYAFANTYRWRTVTLPEGIKRIGDYAFGIVSSSPRRIGQDIGRNIINLPASVEYISETAFFNLDELTAINVTPGNQHFSSPDGVLFRLNQAGEPSVLMVYPAYRQGTSYTIPPTVVEIAPRAFFNTVILDEVIIPPSVRYIGDFAFAQTWGSNTIYILLHNWISFNVGLTSITIPNSVVEIGYSAFQNSPHLTSVTFESGGNETLVIGSHAFDNTRALTNIVLTNRLTEIPNYMFRNSIALSQVNIPNGVAFIGNYAFGAQARGANNNNTPTDIPQPALTDVAMPNIAINVSPSAFNLTSVDIPTLKITTSEAIESRVLHGAIFDINGTMLLYHFIVRDSNNNRGSMFNIAFPPFANTDINDIRVFIWEDFDSMMPSIISVEYEL